MSEFEGVTENSALKAAIIERIQREGGIPFRAFMEMSLYYPHLGYYTSERETMGRAGDYVTSPEASPLFGAMLGRQLREMWGQLGSPATFDLVEAGAGTGVLARDILSWAGRTAPDLAEAIRYTIVEVSERLAERQRARLAAEGLAVGVRWTNEMPSGISGCVLSNELLDAMPVHRVATKNGVLREVFVRWEGERFGEDLRDAPTAAVEHFERLGVWPAEDCRAEVNLGALEWIRDAARAVRRGFLMTIDYGYEAEELYAPWRRDGTLLSFYRHNASTDLYARIGKQDMTSHIDFTSVRRAGEDAGLTTLGIVTQSEFLANLGIGEAMRPPESGELEEYFARRRAVTELLDPGGLGRIRVLVQAKGVGEVQLTGLAGGQ